MQDNPSIALEELDRGYGVEPEVSNTSERALGVSEHEMNENFEVPTVKPVVGELESKFALGTVMTSVEDAYLLYCQYAHAKGFSVRKGDQRFFPRSNELQSKEFECSCQGLKDEKCSSKRIPTYQKPITRTNCKARLKITREKGGDWRVGRFINEHNHEMYAPDQAHLLRSARNISHAKKSTLEAMVNAGISVSNAVSYMENEAHGLQNLGFTRKDAYDHINRMKKHTKVENGDATALLQYFINKANKENYFYWNMQLDDDDRVMNFFFRDYRCLIDYEYFGDVLSIDTTYRTNKYNLICAPFVGINHHMKNVMFGLAFMSDETESSFEWLFTTFLDSMNGKQPQTIFSDQCQAMMNAIETVFPNAHHRLCQWHINQNAPSHLGSLNGDSVFKGLWYKCMTYCECEEEFETTWKFMLDTYNLEGHNWLSGMYKLRKKWSTAFSTERFSASLLATSRSEVTNMVLKKEGSRTSSLYQFVLNYEKIQNNWRVKEKIEDTRCRHSKPAQILKNHPLLTHAADVYTITIYQLFESELVKSLNCKFSEQPLCFGSDWQLTEFKVKSHDENSRIRRVVFNNQNNEIKCSCQKFETMGILCKHALMVFNCMNVIALPKCYILKRWMKFARDRINNEVDETESGNGSGHVSSMVFVNETMRKAYDLSQLCKAHEEARTMLTSALDSVSMDIYNIVQNLSLNDGHSAEAADNDQTDEVHILNPLTAKAKGVTNVSITRHWDAKNKKAKGKGKGKSKAEGSSAKGVKRKVQSSQETTNSHDLSYAQPPQQINFTPAPHVLFQIPENQFPSQFSAHFGPPLWQNSNQMGGSRNIYGQVNLFGYPLGTPPSSQGGSDRN